MCRQRYLDTYNQAVIDRVIKEVKGIDSSVPIFQIRGMSIVTVTLSNNYYYMLPLHKLENVFFRTKVEEDSLRLEENNYDEKVVKQRRRNRLTRVSRVQCTVEYDCSPTFAMVYAYVC